ncbi:UNVERIFIED_CONTAM: hypothetical protein GTU68_022484 [Idotea baltica]|nr:hypothetical protein [Idotea baltica]
MYIGDVGERGLHHLVYEVVDNSIDEAMAGHCENILVTIHHDNSISVRDDGRGIPVGVHEKEGLSALELVMTRLGAGGKFDKNTYKVSGGLHGVGVSCVNALSANCEVHVFRDGKIHEQTYKEGVAQAQVKVVGETTEKGTETRFWPDATIFTTTEYKFDTLASRLRELAYLNSGVRISITDEREPLSEKTFYSEGGLKEFVQFLDQHRNPLHETPIYITGIDKDETTPVEIAIQYNSSYNENIHSYVNNINTHEGGTHISGFKKALTRTLKAYADSSGMLKKIKFAISGEDFREGLTCVLSVKVQEPQFEGQTKTKLGNSEVFRQLLSPIVGKGNCLYYLRKIPNTAKPSFPKSAACGWKHECCKKGEEAVQKKSSV